MTTASKKEKLKRLGHALTGFITLMHAFERYENGHNTYILFLFAGIAFMLVAIFHHILEKRFRLIEITFVIIEGILTLIIAWEYFEAGKQFIQWMYVLAGLLRIISVGLLYKKHKKTDI